VVFPVMCISSISPRFYFRKHAFCFLPLAVILESPHILAIENIHICMSVQMAFWDLAFYSFEYMLRSKTTGSYCVLFWKKFEMFSTEPSWFHISTKSSNFSTCLLTVIFCVPCRGFMVAILMCVRRLSFFLKKKIKAKVESHKLGTYIFHLIIYHEHIFS
jgi:hypothetical protein